jgi:hypothetical protein
MKKSRILAEINEPARGGDRIGVLDQQTMRDFVALHTSYNEEVW